MTISRFNDFGEDITSAIYMRVKEIRLDPTIENKSLYYKKIVHNGARRLDQYAAEYYEDGLDWWIIASASGIGWWLSIEKNTSLYVPTLNLINQIKSERVSV
jgi:hypothetical protein